ncbi:hypothetical protein PGT21_032405 [Puccinia graminis f. sp. tritici]|uniref:Uncharacterized protein n=1 Tax=Puccinia graminis f. sp. tritici TaxID=56615 RepID=A0A5B0QKK7_PUCGR|nr:hypothetical protein PGT21_032405 [Puccinia graminis f. sp. tritici]
MQNARGRTHIAYQAPLARLNCPRIDRTRILFLSAKAEHHQVDKYHPGLPSSSREKFQRLERPRKTIHIPSTSTRVYTTMSPPLSSTQHRDSGAARFLGSGTSGVAELMIFHPVDTLAKRLMSNKSTSLNFNQIVFRNYADAPIGKKFLSLFPGLGYAAGYKILQRIYKLRFLPLHVKIAHLLI